MFSASIGSQLFSESHRGASQDECILLGWESALKSNSLAMFTKWKILGNISGFLLNSGCCGKPGPHSEVAMVGKQEWQSICLDKTWALLPAIALVSPSVLADLWAHKGHSRG